MRHHFLWQLIEGSTSIALFE